MFSGDIALSSCKVTFFDGVPFLVPVIFITTLWHLDTLFNTMIIFSNSIMVYMALCHHELLPFVDEKSQFLWCTVSKSSKFNRNCIKLIHNVKYQNKCISQVLTQYISQYSFRGYCLLFMKRCHYLRCLLSNSSNFKWNLRNLRHNA